MHRFFFGDFGQWGDVGIAPTDIPKCTEPLKGGQVVRPYEEQCVLSGGKKLEDWAGPGALWDLEEGECNMIFDTILRGGTVIDGSGKEGFWRMSAFWTAKSQRSGELSGAQAKKHARCDGTACYAGLYRHPQARGRGAFPGRVRRRGALSGTDDDRQRQLRLVCCAERRSISSGNFRLSHARDRDRWRRGCRQIRWARTLQAAKALELPVNVGMLAGGGTIRAQAAGFGVQRLEKRTHYRKIHRAIERALADGAFGVSLGLGYAPECFL